jgi:hypothetical protein
MFYGIVTYLAGGKFVRKRRKFKDLCCVISIATLFRKASVPLAHQSEFVGFKLNQHTLLQERAIRRKAALKKMPL